MEFTYMSMKVQKENWEKGFCHMDWLQGQKDNYSIMHIT
jgi:hypothetical protein